MLLMVLRLFQPQDWGDLTGVLTWLAAGGSTMVLAWAVAYLAEHWAGWHALPGAVKFIVPIVVSFGLAYGANWALQFTDALAQFQPIWMMLVTAVAGWIATQGGLATAKVRGISARVKLHLR